MYKLCKKCQILKNVDDFSLNSKAKDKKQTNCKLCQNESNKIRQRIRKKEDPIYRESIRLINQEYKSRPEYQQQKKLYKKTFNEKNKEKNREWLRKWTNNNREHVNAEAKFRQRRRRAEDINFKILGNLRHRIWLALRGNIKSQVTAALLGCSIEEFKTFLENQFKAGMTWENYGPIWHIDHIIPCVSFDLSQPKEQQKCFHYSNMRPLWATTDIAEEFGDTDTIGNLNRPKFIKEPVSGLFREERIHTLLV